MSANLAAIAYLVASVLFILALRGLSHPESSRRGNTFGMIGMTIAIVTTILSPVVQNYAWIVIGIVLGGAIGAVVRSGPGSAGVNLTGVSSPTSTASPTRRSASASRVRLMEGSSKTVQE